MTNPKSTADREIVIGRLFNAPPDVVWDACTNPQHVAEWWGPNGFTNTVQEMSVKPGGVFRLIMHGPDGTDYPNRIVFNEVRRPEKLAYEHGADDGGPAHFHVTITFTAKENKTLLRMQSVFPSAEALKYVVEKHGALKGAYQHVNRLAAHLSLRPIERSTDTPFVLSRTFDAPRDLVWKAWTEKDRMTQWFGPKGLHAQYAAFDFRPGGYNHYSMTMPDGKELWGKAVYREIQKPHRLVWVNSFSDKHGGLTRHPFSPDPWPLELLTTITFEESAGKTTVTVHWIPINPSPAERETFNKGLPNMGAGWGGTFQQLEEYLAGNKS